MDSKKSQNKTGTYNNNSTRDIAKAAVEDEVKKAGRGKRRRDVDSSDDDDDNVTTKKRGQEKTRQRDWDTGLKIKSQEQSELSRLAGKYRDRAKERQDGILNDDNVDVAFTNRSVGDEIFDTVVAAVEAGDRQKLKSITTSEVSSTVAGTIPVTSKDALLWISNTRNTANTAFGRDIREYLRKRYLKASSETIPVSAAGRTLQKSILTFSKGINVDPRDRHRSWERPSEQTFATSESHADNENTDVIIPKASVVCNADLLQKIRKCFDEWDRRMQRIELRSKVSEKVTSVEVPSGIKEKLDDSDDDDIFTSVGEYNPDNDDDNRNEISKTAGTIKNPEGTMQKSESIFVDKVSTTTTTTQTTGHFDQMKEPLVQSPMPQSLKGLSSLYPGGYDDDDGIGLDFDGPNYEDDDDGDQTNNKEKKLTRKRGNKKTV